MSLSYGRRALLLQVSISLLVLALLFAFVDVGKIGKQLSQFDRRQSLDFAGLILVLIGAVAARWYWLLGKRLPPSAALHGTALGIGANMVLPARGGDVLRVIYAAKDSAVGTHFAVGALFLEKIIDLLFVAALGVTAISLKFGHDIGAGARTTAMFTGLTVLSAAAAVLLLARRGSLIPIMRQVFRLTRLGPSLYRHAYGPLAKLVGAVRGKALTVPLIVTAALWSVLYPLAYYTVARAIAVPLGYGESVILVFAGALGLAVPAAPSGLGTFHASIVSGFVLLGRDPTEGLALAVAIHAAFFIGLVVPAAVAQAAGPYVSYNKHPKPAR